MIDIEKLKQAALNATQGEWVFDKEDNHISSDGRNTIAQPRSGATISTEQRDRNGDYIATANPSAILELITRLEAAESQLVTIEILEKQLADKDAEIKKLKSRLEFDDRHGWDGIACRDETIKGQNKAITELRQQLSAAQASEDELIRVLVAIAEADNASTWTAVCMRHAAKDALDINKARKEGK